MNVEQVMTRKVVTVAPGLPLKDVAKLLLERGISGAPVCDADGTLLGVVSETDVVRIEEGYLATPRGPFAWLVDHGDVDPRVQATTAREAMTAPAVTAHPSWSIAYAARLMTESSVNRLPVMAHDRLVGIVTRADLLRAFVRDDAEIEREIRTDVVLGTLWIPPDRVEVEVRDGRITLGGRVETRTEAEMVAAYVRRVPGVVDVDASGLAWDEDDLAHRTAIRPFSGAGRTGAR